MPSRPEDAIGATRNGPLMRPVSFCSTHATDAPRSAWRVGNEAVRERVRLASTPVVVRLPRQHATCDQRAVIVITQLRDLRGCAGRAHEAGARRRRPFAFAMAGAEGLR